MAIIGSLDSLDYRRYECEHKCDQKSIQSIESLQLNRRSGREFVVVITKLAVSAMWVWCVCDAIRSQLPFSVEKLCHNWYSVFNNFCINTVLSALKWMVCFQNSIHFFHLLWVQYFIFSFQKKSIQQKSIFFWDSHYFHFKSDKRSKNLSKRRFASRLRFYWREESFVWFESCAYVRINSMNI